jgi:hypothetical protein
VGVPVVVPARYPRLYEAFRETVQKALQLLRSTLANPPQWPTREVGTIIFEENRSHEERTPQEFPQDALRTVIEGLRSDATYQRAVAELERLRAEGRAVPDWFGLDNRFLVPTIANYLEKQRSLDFSEEMFQEVYYQLEDYLNRDSLQVRVYYELQGLEGDEAEVILSETHRIYKLDEAEINRVWKIAFPPWLPTQLFPMRRWPMPGTYLLAAIVSVQKSELHNLSLAMMNEGTRTTSALRFSALGAGPVNFYTYQEEGFEVSIGRLGLAPSSKGGRFSYRLNQASADALKRNWPTAYEFSAALQKTPEKTPTHFRIAGLRFSSSCEKETKEDTLIDYAIAFEALFTKENDAVSYRLPLRTAVFVGDTEARRSEVFALIKTTYDQRSSLAHGQSQLDDGVKVGGVKIAPQELLDKVGAVLFDSLHRFLQSRKRTTSKDEVLRSIDQAIVSMDRQDLERLWS